MASTCKRTGLLLLGATLAVLLLDTATHLISHREGCSAVQGLQPPSTVELGRRDLQQHGLAGIAPELPGAQAEQVDASHQEGPAHDPRSDSEAPLQVGDRPWPDVADSSQSGSATEAAAEAEKGSFALGTPLAADVQTFPQPQAPRYISQPLSLQAMRQLARDQKAFHEVPSSFPEFTCRHLSQLCHVMAPICFGWHSVSPTPKASRGSATAPEPRCISAFSRPWKPDWGSATCRPRRAASGVPTWIRSSST